MYHPWITCLWTLAALVVLAREASCGIQNCTSLDDLLFHCDDGKTCTLRTDFCDGEPTCPDKSDERIMPTATSANVSGVAKCQYFTKKSKNQCVLPARYQCDHEVDCVGGTDECNCDHTFNCANGDCVVKVQFCDGKTECADGTDEKKYNRSTQIGFQCRSTVTHRTNICVLPDEYVCDGESHCDDGIDECFCSFTPGVKKGRYINDSFSNEKCFRCFDESLILARNRVCDGYVHCQDFSDECLCTKPNNVTMHVCPHVCNDTDCSCHGKLQCIKHGGKEEVCLEATSICDGRYDCANGIDEEFCPEFVRMWTCADKKMKIPEYKLCNGPADCDDKSDENNCRQTTNFYCFRLRPYFLQLLNVSDWASVPLDKVVIPSGGKTLFDDPLFAKKCDGIATCIYVEDECSKEANCSTIPGFCKYKTPGNLGSFKCPVSGSAIIGKEICDGTPSCNDTHPAKSEDEMGCPGKFYCKNRGATRLPIHIPASGECNQIQECDDQSDEMHCPTTTHFYCNDSGAVAFIPSHKKCDGTMDCRGGTDECQNCNISPFSSDEKLIRSRVLIVFLWIIGLVAVIGNLAVFTHQLVNLVKPYGTPSKITVCNRILVLNLSLADLFVGIYLISLGIKDATVSRYCLIDQEWRTSFTCSSLGTLALLGTETSVFILLVMTAYRLYIIANPLLSHKTSAVKITVVFAWLMAALLAFIPHADTLKDYFVSAVWFRYNKFMGYATKTEMEKFIRHLITYESSDKQFSTAVSDGYTWDNMLRVMEILNSTYVPEREFDYYSAHSVCLPRLFPNPIDDQSWGYSLFIVLLNFFAFIFILGSYTYIYYATAKKAQASSGAAAEDRTTALQRKISRIVATDFCCWMPICIMAFVKVSGTPVPAVAYAVTAIILLPINAAMNPFLYSSILDIIWEKMLPIRNWCSTTVCGRMMERQGERLRPAQETSATQVTAVGKTNQLGSQESIDTRQDTRM